VRLVLSSLLLLTAACGTTRRGGRWSDDATLLPAPERLAQAARNAITDPWTWVPLAGAGVVAAGGWDREISDWARRETPLFGSGEEATAAGGTLGGVMQFAWIASAFATPSGGEPVAWTVDKARGVSIEWTAMLAVSGATGALKHATSRERPNGSNLRSFPSSASADAFAHNALTRRNLDAIDAPWPVDLVARTGLGAVAAGVAWSRVEAGAHYPTDVLAGAALGNFIAVFVHDAFLGLPDDVSLDVYAQPVAGEYGLGLTFRF
jgi:membrane-associated phospholipid phosphatase